MKEETSRIQQEENHGINYRKPIMIGAGLLIAFFVLFGYDSMSSWFHGMLYHMITGQYYADYLLIIEMITPILCLILNSFGLYFFISGLRKMRKAKEKIEDQNPTFFIILYSIIMITANLFFIYEIIYVFLVTYLEILTESIFWILFGTGLFSGFVVFGFVIIVVIIQNYFLKKNKLIDSKVVKRPVVHFFLLGSLIIWLFFVLNNYLVIIYIPEYFNLPYISSQIITSFLAAGVYLELVIKVKKSKREIKKKQVGEENGEE